MFSGQGRRATRVVGFASVIVVFGLVLLAVALRDSQRSLQRNVLARFGGRAQVVSALTQAVLGRFVFYVAMPAAAFLLRAPTLVVILAGVIGAFVIFLHRANIRRLLNGTEPKVGKKKD